MTSQGESQEEQESPIPLQVFEFQIDPDRNTIIRRALAKRIVRQRELDEEEASTEEDESFLAGDNIAVRRSIVSTPVSPRKRTPEGQQQGKMNAKSRWKTEYLRTRSSSPSGSSIFATEVVVADGRTSVPESSDTKLNGDTLIAHEESKKDDSTDHTGSEPNLVDMDKDKDREPVPSVSETAPSEETKETAGVRTAREPSPDLVEEELLAKLENLKKEKSRLFALFRSTLQRREEGSSTAPTPTSSAQQPSQPLLPPLPPPPPPPPPIPPQMPAEMRARESAKRASDGKETRKTEDHEKRNDTSRSIPKRYVVALPGFVLAITAAQR
ncbi:hypothetical protein BGZ81_009670 [Podila clonocystis]|nr:hypothetical protein BGZ81_009670 [Podila clonocystis]